jgi:DNA-binding Lrp family transcriptional regulator
MLRENSQMRLSLSPYSGIYDAVVPQDHLLRKIKENIDFSFVNPMLKKQYCEDFGRPAKEPEMMFKLMFLKKIYDLSDVRVVSQAQTDMAVKYFLDLEPEASMIDPSLMTKFRKLRITEDILEEMLRETIRQAIDKGIIKSKTIIVDSTHTESAVRPKTVTQVLRELSRKLRREIYQNLYELSERFPEKPEITAELDVEIDYTVRLLDCVAAGIESCDNQELQALYVRIRELIKTDKIREIRSKDDEDARFGHKTPTSTFFGYKNHIAMTEERIIAGIEVTSGEVPDGKIMQSLAEKSKENGMEVKEIIGDMAFVSQGNLAYCENESIDLIARTNPAVAALADEKTDGFVFNKDAKTMQCPAGILAMRTDKQLRDSGNTFYRFVFSKRKCRNCPLFASCPATKKKSEFSYCFTDVSEENRERLAFEQTEWFQQRQTIRYRIEEKNGEMKIAHGLRRADSTGLEAMRLQTYFTAFAVNVKRIITLTTANNPFEPCVLGNLRVTSLALLFFLRFCCLRPAYYA